MPRIDVIVAVRNEIESIPVFLGQLAALSLPPTVTLRAIFVEDSSTDGTPELLRQLAHRQSTVGYWRLARGFGQGIAVCFGLSRSPADAMIMMDVDGSHPVGVIPEMIGAYLAGAEVVQCVRKTLPNRKAYRRIGAAVFQWGSRFLTGVDTRQQNIYFRLVTAAVAADILQPRYWHYVRFPLPRRPGALHTISIDTEERVLGASKYPLGRLIRLAADAVLSLMSGARLTTFLAVLGLLALWGVLHGSWLAALAVAIVAGPAVAHWRHLHRGDALSKIEVVECANVA